MENTIVNDIKKIIDESINLVQINGETYSNRDLRLVRHTDSAEKIVFSDLSSIVSMIKQEKGNFNLPLYINIESATCVSVFSSMDKHKDREEPYSAMCRNSKFSFGREYNYEDFVIALRSQFVQNEDTSELLTLLKKITNNNTVETEDDGITQKITAQQGATLNNVVKSAPIRKLSPFRTFNEVEQPTSEFLFRVKDGGRFILYEADGGAWELKAKKNISTFFTEELAEEIAEGKVILVG